MRAPRHPSALLLASLLLLTANAALAGGGKHRPDDMPPPPPGKALAPAPGAQASPGGASAVASPNAVREGGAADLTFGEPIHYHNITVVPVGTNRKGPFQRYTLFEQGLRAGTLAVREIGNNAQEAQVNAVEVRNTGHESVYLLGGEMILGGKQDRIIQQDTVLGPGGKWTKVAVFCVERGRWAGQNMQFGSAGAVAPPSLRGAAMTGSQGAVWEEVARNNLKHGTQSQTETYRRTVQNAELRGRIEPYRKQLLAMMPRNLQLGGFIFAVNGQIRVADLFGNPLLFQDLQDKLLSSYILEGLGHTEDPRAPALSRGQAAEWLGKARAVKKIEGKGSGRATSFRKDSASAFGSETYDDAAPAAPVRETYITK